MIEYFICNSRQAASFEGFMLPEVRQREDRDLFWYFIAADYELGVLGMLVVNPLKEKPQILSVGVSEEYHRRGIGSELISKCSVALKEAGAKIVCLCIEIPDPDLESFFYDCGFEVQPDCGYRYRVKLKEIHKKEIFNRPTKRSENILVLGNLDSIYTQRIATRLNQLGVFHQIDWSQFDPNFSLMIPGEEDYTIQAAIMCHVTEETVHIDWLYLNPMVPGKMLLLTLFQNFYQKISAALGDDIELEMTSMNKLSDKLIRYFWDDVEPFQTVCEYMKWLY